MTKHDTWVYLKPDSPYREILHLFPDGIPMRDPFPLERANGEFRGVSLWIVDLERLKSSQAVALTQCIARHLRVSETEVFQEANSKGGFAVNNQWIEGMNCGPEGMQRSKELEDFLETAPQPPSESAFMEFYNDQHQRWIEGNEEPPPVETIEDVDPRLRTPELEAAMLQNQVNRMLQNYSAFDVLTGRAMVDILNHFNPNQRWSLVGDDEEFEEFEDDEIYE
jgi:hypothetical protein